jgi:small neutral amino acid transporter SnatA (MarC family)
MNYLAILAMTPGIILLIVAISLYVSEKKRQKRDKQEKEKQKNYYKNK